MHNELEFYRNTFDRIRVSESTRTEVMRQMVNYEEKKWAVKIPKRLIIVASVVAALTLSIAAYAVAEFCGFAYSDQMSGAQVDQILYDTSHGMGHTVIDSNGNVQIMDANGTIVAEMTEAEYYAYEREQLRLMEENAQTMTDLIDLSTLELSPWGVEEVTVTDGKFPDFILSNGYMIVLTDASGDAFTLEKGQLATICVTANDACYVEACLYKDGKLVEERTENTKTHSFTFEIPKDGDYCFSLMYFSASASNFTDCKLDIA